MSLWEIQEKHSCLYFHLILGEGHKIRIWGERRAWGIQKIWGERRAWGIWNWSRLSPELGERECEPVDNDRPTTVWSRDHISFTQISSLCLCFTVLSFVEEGSNDYPRIWSLFTSLPSDFSFTFLSFWQTSPTAEKFKVECFDEAWAWWGLDTFSFCSIYEEGSFLDRSIKYFSDCNWFKWNQE